MSADIPSANTSNFQWGPAPTLDTYAMVKAIVLAVMAIISIIGNLLTIISIYKTKRSDKSSLYTLINHVAISDLLVSVFCMSGESAWTYTVQWMAGNVACKLFKYLQLFSLYLSTFVLTLIGIDRYMAIRNPITHAETQRKYGTGVIILVWILSGILSFPQTMIFRVKRGPFVEDFYQCVTYGFYKEPWHEKIYTVLTFLIMFVIPLLILMITYTAMFVTLQKSERLFQVDLLRDTRHQFPRRKILRRAKMKTLKISILIVAAFVICWTPYFIRMFANVFRNESMRNKDESKINFFIFCFGMLNSLINPVIYGAFHLCQKSKGNYMLKNGVRRQLRHGYLEGNKVSIRSRETMSTIIRSFWTSHFSRQGSLKCRSMDEKGVSAASFQRCIGDKKYIPITKNT